MTKKLEEAGVDNFEYEIQTDCRVKNKIKRFKRRGYSYQAIANKFNLWKVKTRSGKGKWYGKTVRDLLF